ncbi:hypothetical protein NEOKW01_2052 [Nematocida sp. AWRm80]|nr:hypothetical protein NEOKW01_2052 [Nematocida sp. AWRm80]
MIYSRVYRCNNILLVIYIEKDSIFSILRVVIDNNVLYIDRLENKSTIRGLCRVLVIDTLRMIIEYLRVEYKSIIEYVYIYSRASDRFYLSNNNHLGMNELNRYWCSILDGINCKYSIVDYRSIRNSNIIEVFNEYKDIIRSSKEIEDNPIGRIIKNIKKKDIKASEIITILCNSKDISNGSLIFGRISLDSNYTISKCILEIVPGRITVISSDEMTRILQSIDRVPEDYKDISFKYSLDISLIPRRIEEIPVIKLIRPRKKIEE